jgi:hypothetical protein
VPLAIAAAIGVAGVAAQTVDAQLAAYIDSIRAIDDHAHVVAPDVEHDTGYDALPCNALTTSALPPANFRFGPNIIAAWKALYGFSAPATATGSDEDIKAARQAQSVVRSQQGDRYFSWVLDRSGIDVALANRVAMTPPLAQPRFLWVPYEDALLFPLDNTDLETTHDRKVFFERESQLLKTYAQHAAGSTLPTSFDAYLDFVSTTLARQRNAGAVAIKFEAAYLRALDFAPAARSAAAAVFTKYIGVGPPSFAEYRVLQDFVFRYMLAEAGRLGLPVHIHTGFGCGDSYEVAGANPLLLESSMTDPALRHTTFVLLHGAFVERDVASLIAKPNVYADTSMLELLWSPSELARVLRVWIEVMPEHVLFGTDAGPNAPGLGWEESTWLGSRKARQALTAVLSQMVNEKVITSARAREIASRVLRDNAVELYRIGTREAGGLSQTP